MSSHSASWGFSQLAANELLVSPPSLTPRNCPLLVEPRVAEKQPWCEMLVKIQEVTRDLTGCCCRCFFSPVGGNSSGGLQGPELTCRSGLTQIPKVQPWVSGGPTLVLSQKIFLFFVGFLGGCKQQFHPLRWSVDANANANPGGPALVAIWYQGFMDQI